MRSDEAVDVIGIGQRLIITIVTHFLLQVAVDDEGICIPVSFGVTPPTTARRDWAAERGALLSPSLGDWGYPYI